MIDGLLGGMAPAGVAGYSEQDSRRRIVKEGPPGSGCRMGGLEEGLMGETTKGFLLVTAAGSGLLAAILGVWNGYQLATQSGQITSIETGLSSHRNSPGLHGASTSPGPAGEVQLIDDAAQTPAEARAEVLGDCVTVILNQGIDAAREDITCEAMLDLYERRQ